MKRSLYLIIITLALISCISNIQPYPPATSTAEIVRTVPGSEEPTWNVYDPDPDHIWNRVFRQFYSRTAKDGREFGLGELDPLLWFDTTYMLNGASHRQAIQVLDEFLTTDAEKLIADPLKRAMFQRDLWAVFDWLAFQSYENIAEREALKIRLTQIMKRVALTKEQIVALPDNYALAVQSQTFPADFQPENPNVAFLPADLFQQNSAWVPMGREGGPIAISHTEGFPFFGRSVFLVFVRSPNGRKATFDLIDALNTDPNSVSTVGIDVALVRQMLLIDAKGDLVLSPLVETIQLRHFNPEQIFHEFELDRIRLLNGHADTFHLKSELFMLFSSHGDVFEFHELPVFQATIPEVCKGCHFENPPLPNPANTQSILSYSRRSFPLLDNEHPILISTSWIDEAQIVIEWKHNHPTWQALKTLWNQ